MSYVVKMKGSVCVAGSVLRTPFAMWFTLSFESQWSFLDAPSAVKEEVERIMLERRRVIGDGVKGEAPAPGVLGETHPLLFEQLTATKYGDGSARTVCTLNVFGEDGKFKGALHDRDAEASLWVAAETFEELLEGLELLLTDDQTAQWRKWKTTTARKGGNRK